MKRQAKKRSGRNKLKTYKLRTVKVKRVKLTEKKSGDIIKKIYKVDPITGKKKFHHTIRIDATTGKRSIVYQSTRVFPDHYPPIPDGAKEPKPNTSPDNSKGSGADKNSKHGN